MIVTNDLFEFCTKAAKSTERPGADPGWFAGFQNTVFHAFQYNLKSIL